MTMTRRPDIGKISQGNHDQLGRPGVRSGTWITLVVIASVQWLFAQQPGVYVPAEDARNTNITTVTTHMPLPEFTNLKAWEQRKAFLRSQILVSAGLSP